MSLGNKDVMAKNIKKYMNKKSVNASDVCAALGFKHNTFSDWVHAKTYPRIDKIEMMANYFNCSKADLVEDNHISLNSEIGKENANHIIRYNKLNDRDKEIINNMIDTMIKSYQE